jgi:hypothetical protein
MVTRNKLVQVAIAMCAAFVVSGCYEKFDEDSFKPPFEIGGFSASSDIASGNLVGYWPFDGDFVNTVSGQAGTNAGTTFVNGFKGQAIKGATNAYVSATPSTAILAMKSFTVSMWVNTPPPSNGIIGIFSLAKTDGFWGNLEMFFENGSSNTDGKFRTHMWNGANDIEFASNGVAGMFDKWVHIAATYDMPTTTYKLYVNGTVVSTVVNANAGGLTVANAGNIVFGTVQFMTTPSVGCCGKQDWASYLTGEMDEVRIYNKALTPAELNALVVLQGKGK